MRASTYLTRLRFFAALVIVCSTLSAAYSMHILAGGPVKSTVGLGSGAVGAFDGRAAYGSSLNDHAFGTIGAISICGEISPINASAKTEQGIRGIVHGTVAVNVAAEIHLPMRARVLHFR